ncbi:SDR family NAD(P)-dependent oxidoreductase [Mesobacterium pallidum]|uniref:SDR family NAD(P)-dependent oxidoreductase n=1 Tax=Mesobacterium pallidum TaxID=2872037 RepID=UPI001EE200A0|nr:SDR family oxidoreductase [Mesobacterium pallidum]
MTERTRGPALVVGGTGGLGAAICAALVAEGRPVVFTYRSDPDKAQRQVEALGGPDRVACIRADTTRPETLDAAVARANEWCGPPQTAVFATGVHIEQPFISRTAFSAWQQVIDVELLGLIRLVDAVLPSLREAEDGNIVAITSVATASYPPGDALSAVPKAGMETLMRALAREEGRYGVRANCVAPGLMDAGLGAEFIQTMYSPEIWDQQRRRIALGRFGTAEDVAGIVAFLAGPAARYVTGQTIYADGGFRL